MDDNGCKVLIQSFTTRAEAESAMAVFEARGHKQTYWVEESSSDGASK